MCLYTGDCSSSGGEQFNIAGTVAGLVVQLQLKSNMCMQCSQLMSHLYLVLLGCIGDPGPPGKTGETGIPGLEGFPGNLVF